MFDQLTATRYLEQASAVWNIEKKFGKDFVYDNDSGNQAIDKKVLAEFRKLTDGKAVWERGERAWRLLVKGERYEGRQVN
ncbi:hypothetical protein PO883_31720 [Massilia sp. DJPM01]|nr:hypothetical protein [Massilia sp. DJPM01]MDM5181751.1 hypothetical protein [Massilia sp. DJPM01]